VFTVRTKSYAQDSLKGVISLMSNPPQILLATGGTAGHIFPAVALARALEPHGLSSAIIGGLGGMEQGIATRENLGFTASERARLIVRVLTLERYFGLWLGLLMRHQ
jgi:UDP-N-acetylglucosamine:LPS N-acetylglucosamine transferase